MQVKDLKIKPEADLREANLREADLYWADLRRADLREANLREANLREADLRRADLRGADLRGADLRGADLREADLRRADLRGADLQGSYLLNTAYRASLLRPDGYIVLYLKEHDWESIQAGCRWFNSKEEALNHWSDSHPRGSSCPLNSMTRNFLLSL